MPVFRIPPTFQQRQNHITPPLQTLVKSFLTTQAQTSQMAKQANSLRVVAQRAPVVQIRLVSITRIVAQATTATTSGIKVILRALVATQAQTAIQVQKKIVGYFAFTSQATSVIITRAISITRITQQVMSALLSTKKFFAVFASTPRPAGNDTPSLLPVGTDQETTYSVGIDIIP